MTAICSTSRVGKGCKGTWCERIPTAASPSGLVTWQSRYVRRKRLVVPLRQPHPVPLPSHAPHNRESPCCEVTPARLLGVRACLTRVADARRHRRRAGRRPRGCLQGAQDGCPARHAHALRPARLPVGSDLAGPRLGRARSAGSAHLIRDTGGRYHQRLWRAGAGTGHAGGAPGLTAGGHARWPTGRTLAGCARCDAEPCRKVSDRHDGSSHGHRAACFGRPHGTRQRRHPGTANARAGAWRVGDAHENEKLL
jgi:hypothetical protein